MAKKYKMGKKIEKVKRISSFKMAGYTYKNIRRYPAKEEGKYLYVLDISGERTGIYGARVIAKNLEELKKILKRRIYF